MHSSLILCDWQSCHYNTAWDLLEESPVDTYSVPANIALEKWTLWLELFLTTVLSSRSFSVSDPKLSNLVNCSVLSVKFSKVMQVKTYDHLLQLAYLSYHDFELQWPVGFQLNFLMNEHFRLHLCLSVCLYLSLSLCLSILCVYLEFGICDTISLWTWGVFEVIMGRNSWLWRGSGNFFRKDGKLIFSSLLQCRILLVTGN